MATIKGIRKMPWRQFSRIETGTEIRNYDFWDGTQMRPGNQCVAVANLYVEGVLGLPLPAGYDQARDWWEQHDKQPNSYRNFTKSKVPVKGALVVMLGGKYDALHGHIGVVTHVYPDGTFNTREQNAGDGDKRWMSKHTRDMQNVLGFLVPKVNPAQPSVAPVSKPGAKHRNSRKRIRKSGAIIRQQSSTDSAKIGRLGAQELVTVTGWANGARSGSSRVWLRVKDGWVHSSRFRVFNRLTLRGLREYG